MPCRCVDGLLAVQLVLTSSGTLYCSFFVLHSVIILVLYSASASGSDGGFACRRSWIPFLGSMAIVWAIRYKADMEASVERLLEREEEDGILLCKCVEELRRKGTEFDLLKEVDALWHAKILRVEAIGQVKVRKWSPRDLATMVLIAFSCAEVGLRRHCGNHTNGSFKPSRRCHKDLSLSLMHHLHAIIGERKEGVPVPVNSTCGRSTRTGPEILKQPQHGVIDS